MLADREGRFKARIIEHGVTESGKNRLACFVARFLLIDELRAGTWQPVEPDLQIQGYFYLENKDGGINIISVERLKDALGWDGRDPMWLQDTDLSSVIVQVKLASETWNGKTRLKVQYLDPGSTRPRSVPQADADIRRTVGTRLGSKLRAIAGSPPAAPTSPSSVATSPTLAVPKPPPAKPPVAAPPVASLTPQAAMEQAWAAIVEACPKDWTPEHIAEEWFRILADLFPGLQPNQLTVAQWTTLKTEGPDKVVPF